jgi:hypothetical protein
MSPLSAVLALPAAFHAGRKLLTLLLVLVAAATIYVQWQVAEHEKRDLKTRAERICAATAGATPAVPFVNGKRGDWGVACLDRVSQLALFRAQTVEGSLSEAIKDLDARNGKQSTDAALAAAYAARTNDTLKRMEEADAAIQNDRVGPGWAAAVNDLGGLR